MLLELSQNGIPVIFLDHVYEIDNHDAAEIAQAKLPGNCLRGLQIGLEYRIVKITGTDKSARVDVNRGQGFGLVNDEVTA